MLVNMIVNANERKKNVDHAPPVAKRATLALPYPNAITVHNDIQLPTYNPNVKERTEIGYVNMSANRPSSFSPAINKLPANKATSGTSKRDKLSNAAVERVNTPAVSCPLFAITVDDKIANKIAKLMSHLLRIIIIHWYFIAVFIVQIPTDVVLIVRTSKAVLPLLALYTLLRAVH